MTSEQIIQAEMLYNELKAVNSTSSADSPEFAQAYEQRCQMEQEWFDAGYKFVPRGIEAGFYLKAVDNEQ
jgi:hypothetical protein